jgi:hypothetical protein
MRRALRDFRRRVVGSLRFTHHIDRGYLSEIFLRVYFRVPGPAA